MWWRRVERSAHSARAASAPSPSPSPSPSRRIYARAITSGGFCGCNFTYTQSQLFRDWEVLHHLTMATNYATQTFTIPEHQLYASQQPSPASSASPASPRMHEYLQQVAPNPYKQLRPMKSPLYVPAALRPTEHFSTASPMTPPKSLHGSLDNLEDEPVSQSPEEEHLGAFDPDWLQAEELNNVTGPPKRITGRYVNMSPIPRSPLQG